MIDYDKIKMAYELLNESGDSLEIRISKQGKQYDTNCILIFTKNDAVQRYQDFDIDNIINKLKELTKND
jgi:hypothetical protein